MSEQEPRYIRQAEEIIEDSAEGCMAEAYARLERELHGKGCGCMQCLHMVVNEMNRITDFISKGKDPVTWYVHKDGYISWYMDYDKLDEITP